MNDVIPTIRRFAASRHRRRLARTIANRLALPVVLFGGVSAILHLLFALIPYTFFILLWIAAGATTILAILAVIVDTLLIHRPSVVSTMRALEKGAAERLPHPLPALALELSRSTDRNNELYEEIFRQAIGQLEILRAGSSEPSRFTRRGILTAVMILVFFLLHVPLTPRLGSYWRLPFGSLQQQQLAVFPGTVRLPRNASVTLRLQARGSVTAPSCRVLITDLERSGSHTRRLYPDSLGRFTSRLDSVTSSFTYAFVYGTVRCDIETVTVVQPPLIEALQVSLVPPAYTGRPERALPEGQGDFTAYSGTKAHISITSSPLEHALLLYGTDTIPFSISDTSARCTLAVQTGGFYTFALSDIFGQHSDSLSYYSVAVLTDEPPTVRILRPGINKPLEPAQQETLLVEATDDLGIRTLTLHYYQSGKDKETASINLSPTRPAPLISRQFTWKLSRLSLYPGDTVFYWARSRDTRTLGTPQFASSDTFFFRIPSFDEIHRAMARRDADVKERIAESLGRNEQLMKNIEQLGKTTTGEKKQTEWEQQQLAEKIESLLKAQADSLQTSLEQLEENVAQLRNEGTLGEEIARKMDEIRKTMEELIRQYGDSLLFNRNEQGDITMNDLRKAVDKLKEMLPELNERLDNTLQFLEALKRDRDLADLAMRSEKLAREQSQLSEQSPSDPTTAQRQKDLLDRIDELKKDIRSTLENSPETEASLQQLDSLSSDIDGQLSQGATPGTEKMQQMSASLASLSQKLHEKTMAFQREQLEALRNRLLDLAGGTIGIAEWQQQLRRTVKPGSDDETLRRRALEQQAVNEALGHLDNSFDSLPLLAPSLRRQLRSDLNSARRASAITVESMGTSDGAFGMQLGEQALNRLSGKLLDIVDALEGGNQGSCNSPGGMQESLRKMSGKQAAINSATANLLRSLMQGQQGSNGSKEGGDGKNNEAARKEAQEAQRKIADELRELGEKFGDATGEGMRKRIRQLEEEARNLTRMLNEPREEVTERQDRFLARMLQSALSLHREEEGKEERTSKAAEIVFTPTAGTLTDSAAGTVDAFQRLRRRALHDGNYPLSYRRAINSYFDSLGVLYLRASGTETAPQE